MRTGSERVVLPFRLITTGAPESSAGALEVLEQFRSLMVDPGMVAVAVVGVTKHGATYRRWYAGSVGTVKLAGAAGWLQHGLHEAD